MQKNKISSHISVLVISLSLCGLVACDDKNKQNTAQTSNTENTMSTEQTEKAEVLPFLNIQEQAAKYALPFCEKKDCIEIDIQTIHTQDEFMNQWIAESQAKVIQDQLGLKQAMSLQQAVNAYVKASDLWQSEFKTNKAYELHIQTRIAAQRNQYVLLQVIINTQQEEVSVKDRGYFFVVDRKLHKKLSLLDVIEAKQQNAMNEIIQAKYAEWLKEQTPEVRKAAPPKLYWGQNDWFFDGEGIGVHYRANEIVKEGKQLDIYLSNEQTQQMVQANIFQKMF